jgi:hypothetical protein
MRAAFDGATNTASVVFRDARCGIHTEATSVAAAARTPQRTENMGSSTCLAKRPTVFFGIGYRRADVLVGMIGHALSDLYWFESPNSASDFQL